MTSTYTVTGMTCGHCVQAVTDELTKLDGVSAVEIDLPTGRVDIEADREIPAEDVRVAVEEAGYEVAGREGTP